MRADIHDATLFYETLGHGPTLLTLHGGLGFDHTTLRPWLDPLSDVFELVYFDQRGCGRSTSTRSLDGATHATWADDADALCAALGKERVILFGHSYGAFLALETALRHPERLSGLVLSNVAAVIDYPELIMKGAEERCSPEVLQALATRFGRPVTSDDDFRAMYSAIAPAYFHHYDAAREKRTIDGMQMRAEAFNATAGRLIGAYDVHARLGEIRVPTLILAGRHDLFFPLERAPARVHAGIPGSKLVVLEESAHYPFVEEQGAFLAAIRTWARESRLIA